LHQQQEVRQVIQWLTKVTRQQHLSFQTLAMSASFTNIECISSTSHKLLLLMQSDAVQVVDLQLHSTQEYLMLTSTINTKGKSQVGSSFYNVTQQPCQCSQIQAVLIALNYLGSTSQNLASAMESTQDMN